MTSSLEAHSDEQATTAIGQAAVSCYSHHGQRAIGRQLVEKGLGFKVYCLGFRNTRSGPAAHVNGHRLQGAAAAGDDGGRVGFSV